MSQVTEQFLKELIQQYRRLNDVSISGRTVSGTAKDQQSFTELRDFFARYDTQYGLELEADASECFIEFKMPAGKCHESLDRILKIKEYRFQLPSDVFCVLESGLIYAKHGKDNHQTLKNYSDATDLLNMLKNKADHVTANHNRDDFVFLGKNKKLVILDFYFPADLTKLEGLDDFKRQFSLVDDAHKKQRDDVLKNSLIDFFDGSTEIHFSEVLKNFTKIRAESQKGLDLYLSEFSYEKIKKEVEKDKFDFTVRMNKVFGDIQGQLISIPLAIIVAGGQMVVKTDQSYAAKNLVILLGYLFFVILMLILILNQRNTLSAIKDEYEGHWRLIEEKHSKVASRFQSSFDQLKGRYKYQYCVLNVILGFVVISMVGISALYFCLS